MTGYHLIERQPQVVGNNYAVSSSHYLATEAGIDILKHGGNSADAALAVAAVLAVVVPGATGLGGDGFALWYNGKSKKVEALNGSGRSPARLTVELLKQQGFSETNHVPETHPHSVSVPGVPHLWATIYQKYSSKKFSFKDLLEPAIKLAENGYTVSEHVRRIWKLGENRLRLSRFGERAFLPGGAIPKIGQKFVNTDMSKTLKILAEKGIPGFYEGEVAKAIVEELKFGNGVMELDDLKNHKTQQVEPISIVYKGKRIYELPPNTEGMALLIALNILKGYNLKAKGHNSAEYLHVLMEAMKLGFNTTFAHNADPDVAEVDIDLYLSDQYADDLRSLIRTDRTINIPKLSTSATDQCHRTGTISIPKPEGGIIDKGDTVYFSIVDSSGDAISIINSVYMEFGSGIVAKNTGFALQNRAQLFTMREGSPNQFGPSRRPFTTLMPGLITDDETGELLATIGAIGGFGQPQANLQVILNIVEFGMDPQVAVSASRFCLVGTKDTDGSFTSVKVEEGISDQVMEELRRKGHDISKPPSDAPSSAYGLVHPIAKGSWWNQGIRDDIDLGEDVLWPATDPRDDGHAMAS